MSDTRPATLTSLDDGDLVVLAQDGVSEAFDVLVRRHTPRLYALAIGMMRTPHDARDALQDAWLSAHRRLDGFRGDAAFGSWMYRVTTNACLMRLRRRRRRPEVSLEATGDFDDDGSWSRPVVDLAPRVDALMESAELGRAIEAAMDTLPDSYRAVFVLADLEHRSMKEIAQTLDLTVPNVKTRLHRARLKLRAALADYLAGEPTDLLPRAMP